MEINKLRLYYCLHISWKLLSFRRQGHPESTIMLLSKILPDSGVMGCTPHMDLKS